MPEIYDVLKEYNFEDPDEITKPKYLISPVNIIVFDDLKGSTIAFSTKKASVLYNNLIKYQHNSLSFAILTQSVKSVPKNIRANCNLVNLLLKKIVLQDMYMEVSNVLTEEQFEELYNHCVDNNQYGSLIIDTTHKERRFFNGLDIELIIK